MLALGADAAPPSDTDSDSDGAFDLSDPTAADESAGKGGGHEPAATGASGEPPPEEEQKPPAEDGNTARTVTETDGDVVGCPDSEDEEELLLEDEGHGQPQPPEPESEGEPVGSVGSEHEDMVSVEIPQASTVADPLSFFLDYSYDRVWDNRKAQHQVPSCRGSDALSFSFALSSLPCRYGALSFLRDT